MSQKTRATLVTVAIIVILLILAMATQFSGDPFWSPNGLWSVLPPLIAISLAFVTKNVVVSLLCGMLSGTFLLNIHLNIFQAISESFVMGTQFMLGSLADSWNAGIILQVLAIGGLIGLVTKLGGARAIAERLAVKAKGPISAQVITWLMGLIVFFDDYANSLIIGPIMRPVTDKNRISREKLSFIIDATAAPIAGIALISTWIGAEISYIRNGLEMAGIEGLSPYNLFVASIPHRFYNLAMLAFVLLSALTLRDFGPMRQCEQRARSGDIRAADPKAKVTEQQEIMMDDMPGKSNIWNAIVPLGTLIVGSLLGFFFNGRMAIIDSADSELLDIITGSFSFAMLRECFGAADASIVLFQAALLAGIVALIMGLIQKRFSLDEGITIWISGVKSLVITCVILILAWSLSSSIGELGTAPFLVSALSDAIPPWCLPAIIFILGSLISFATGTSYGTMAILMPLALPFAHTLMPNDYSYLVACAGAVMTGAIFGDHCSPISDTTILSSMGADCDHIAHVSTQIWYALTVAALVIVFGYLPTGFGLNVWLSLLLTIGAVFCAIMLLGKRVAPANLEKGDD